MCMCKCMRKRGKEAYNIRVLEAMAAFVAAEKLVGETNVTAHAANGLKIHHCFGVCAHS